MPESRSNCLQTRRIHHQVKYQRLNANTCIVAAILFSGHPYIGRHYRAPYKHRETLPCSLINTNALSRPEQNKLMLRLQLLECAASFHMMEFTLSDEKAGVGSWSVESEDTLWSSCPSMSNPSLRLMTVLCQNYLQIMMP